MTWLTWRQLRTQSALVYAALLALAVVVLATRSGVVASYHANVGDFLPNLESSRRDTTLYEVGSFVVWAVPAVIGVFWGAPLIARELEAGTHRLVWSQSVSRNRWLATKLVIGVVAAMGASALVSLALTWWCSPVDKAVAAGAHSTTFGVPRIVPEIFGARGIAPIGYAAFAFVLGVLAGALLRRTVPAMAAVLVVYVAVQVALPFMIRPHLAPATVQTITITRDNLHGMMGKGPGKVTELDVGAAVPGAWVQENQTVGASGRPLGTIPGWVVGCLPAPPVPDRNGPASDPGAADPTVSACFDRLEAEGVHQRVRYQPADHYWTLQWRETGLMLGVAAALAGGCFWRLRRLA